MEAIFILDFFQEFAFQHHRPKFGFAVDVVVSVDDADVLYFCADLEHG